MSNNLEGKIAVITGASSGLGEAIARLLSAQGASVVLGARRVDRRLLCVAGHKVGPGFAVYAATKHAVRTLSEGLHIIAKVYHMYDG